VNIDPTQPQILEESHNPSHPYFPTDIQMEKTGDTAATIGGEDKPSTKHDDFPTAKLADTAVVEEQKLQEHANENNDRRWRTFTPSKKRRDKAVDILKVAIITQMTFRPLVAWLEHLYKTSESTSRLINTTACLIGHCPYWLSFGIIACSLAWLWRRTTRLFFNGLGLVTVSLSLLLYYYRTHYPENFTQFQTHATAFWAAFWFLDFDFVLWLVQSRLRRAVKLQQDAPEAGDADAHADSSGNGKMSLATMYHALKRKPRADGGFLQTNFASRLALAAVVLFDIFTLVYLPPDMLADYLTTLSCEVRVEDLHSNGIFYEITAHPRSNSSFLGLGDCSESQQWASLIREMNKHADETRAKAEAYAARKAAWTDDWDDSEIDYDQPVSCVAWCFRTGENDELQGLMSHPLGPDDLPEMFFCRGEHGYSGDCAKTGLRLGFDVTKKGWMNDYLGSFHDAGDGPEGEVWDANRRVHWNGEELEFPELNEEEGGAVVWLGGPPSAA
jgi:hypothetical protein